MATTSLAPTAPGFFGAAPVLAAPNNGSTAGVIQSAPITQPSAVTVTKTSTAPVAAPTPQATPQPTPVSTPAATPINTSLQMTPSEMSGGAAGIAAYNARIAAANPNLPAPGTTSSTGVTNSVPATSANSIMPTPGVLSTTNPTTPTTPTTPVATPADDTHSGTLQTQANTSATDPTQTPAYQAAQTLYNNAEASYNQIQNELAITNGKLETGDQALPVVLGQEGALQKQYAGQLDAYATTMQQAQASMNTAISGYSAQTSAENNTTTQTQPSNEFIQQSPSSTLVGANGQPIAQTSGASGSLVSPLTGNPITSSGNPKQDAAVSTALQDIANGSGYANAVNAAGLSLYGTAAISQLQSGLPAGFNINASNAKASTQAQNINTSGTAGTNAAAQNLETTNTAATTAANAAYQSAVQKVAANTATYNGLTGVSTNLNSTLANWGNTGLITNYNAALNSLAGLTSNPEYQQFVTALGNAQASYQAALGASGVTPTKADQDALAALNPDKSATAINAALNQLSSDAHALLIVPAYQQQDTYAQQLGIQ